MELPNDQASYWDRVAGEKTFSHPLDADLFGQYATRTSRVLEVGCGYGRVLDLLHHGGWRRTVGVDSAEAMIRRGRATFPHLDLRHHAEGPLPFENESFDAALLFSVLTCVPDPAAQSRLIDDVERVLRSGGVVYVSDLLLQEDERNRVRYEEGERAFGVQGVFQLPEGVTLAHFATARIGELFGAFEVAHFAEFDVHTMNGNVARAFQLIARRA